MYDIAQSSFVDSFHEGGRFISEALIIEYHRLGGLKIISEFIFSQSGGQPVLILSGGWL